MDRLHLQSVDEQNEVRLKMLRSKHDSQDLPYGTYSAGRATRNLDRFAIRREDASIVVDLQHWFESDKNPSGWASAVVQV